jgi:glycosyltransferase involved in cell wall biosynthesis
VITRSLPLPANEGGRQRTLALVRRLAALSEVTLCALDDGDADWGALDRLGVAVRAARRPSRITTQVRGVAHVRSAAGRFWSAELAEAVRRAGDGRAFDNVVVGYSHMAPYRPLVDARRSVLDLHNVESHLLRRLAGSRGPVRGLLPRAEAVAMARLERNAVAAFDVVSVVSVVDRERLRPWRDDVIVAPNGFDPEPALSPAQEPVAAFVALMGWRPNVDAAVWLVRTVWPQVLERVPEARLLLVGRDPTPAVRGLAGPGVEVTGTVPDVRPHLATARVALAPLLVGGGSRLKILQALGAGRPVVATPIGVEGLEHLVDRGVVVEATSEGFAAAAADLLRSPARAAQLGRLGRATVLRHHSWDRTLAPLLASLAL